MSPPAVKGLIALALVGTWVESAFCAMHQDHLVSGGGKVNGAGHQVAWSALGQPLGGRMAGGGFMVNGGAPPPPAGGNRAPQITAFGPADKSRFYPPATVTLSVTAADPDGDPLEVRFLADGAALQDWSSVFTAAWDTAAVSFGWHALRVEVKDAADTVSRESRAFVFHRPPSP